MDRHANEVRRLNAILENIEARATDALAYMTCHMFAAEEARKYLYEIKRMASNRSIERESREYDPREHE